MRAPGPGDFSVPVDGVGDFTFARRSMRDVFRIRGEYNSLTGGFYGPDGEFADVSALAFATLAVLVVAQPPGFDFTRLDPLVDDECADKVLKVFAALREKELSFRPGSVAPVEAQSQGVGQ